MPNNYWNGGNNCAPITESGNVFGDATINASIWDEVFPEEAV
jgi:hypothetical protein